MQSKEISTERAPAAVGPYSQAVTLGQFVFTSGAIGLKPDGSLAADDVVGQTHQIFANLEEILAASGSSLDRVVKATCFLTDMNDFAAFNEVYASYFTDFKPARSTVEVSRLPKDVIVEVELIAYTG